MSDAEVIERLRPEVEELRRENADLRRDNAELRRRLAQAMKENEQWRRGHRERSRRRCSRPEGSRRPSTGRARGGQPGHRGVHVQPIRCEAFAADRKRHDDERVDEAGCLPRYDLLDDRDDLVGAQA